MTGAPRLPAAFLSAPIAHRGLHDRALGRPENSLSAMAAAVDAGFAIELDLHPSADGVAMVFHDATLERLTDAQGRVDARTAADLGRLSLLGSEQTIPSLGDVLSLVDGRVPVLIELKDQSGTLTEAPPVLENAVAEVLRAYKGPVAVMAFNPNMVTTLAERAPHTPRGLVTAPSSSAEYAHAPPSLREAVLSGPDLTRTHASFVSHDHRDLDRRWISRYRADGVPVLCWTVRSAEEEARARLNADNVTFEGYLPRRMAP